jgi:hypothetical protein
MALTVLISHADGSTSRFGADEPDAAAIPQGITWTSQVPGGWKDASFDLVVRIDEDVNLRLLDEVEIVDENGSTVYEGRVSQLPRQHGDSYLQGVRCMGWAAHLLDDPSVPYFFIDRNMGSWGQAGLDRIVQYGANPYGTDYTASSGGGFLQFEGPADTAGGRTVLQNSIGELFYQAPVGTKVTSVQYQGTESNATNTTGLDLYTDDNRALSSGTGVSLTLDDTLRAQALTEDRFATMSVAATGNHTPTAPYKALLSKLAMYGNTGLTSVSWSSTEPAGFYIDDMLAWALSRGAPKLNYTTGVDGSIQRPPVVVPHAADLALGTTERIVMDLNKYVIYDWLVYHGRTFIYRPTDPDRLTWDARLDRGIFLNLEGDDVERAINGLVVKYTDSEGTSKVAGPTGSGLDYESDLLADTDSEATVNRHGYTKKWAEMDISVPLADDSYAAVIGAAYLYQTQLPSRSGDIEVTGTIDHPTKGARPVREVLAGDYVQVSDHPADVPRRCTSVTYTDDDRKARISVGNDLNKVDAILEQLGVRTQIVTG